MSQLWPEWLHDEPSSKATGSIYNDMLTVSRWNRLSGSVATTLNFVSGAQKTSILATHLLCTVFLDAPTVLVPVDPKHEIGDPAITLSIVSTSPACFEPTRSPPYSATPRGWFTIMREGTQAMSGIEKSLELLLDVLQKHKFEVGVFANGFSRY
jgi:hypothetical protein